MPLVKMPNGEYVDVPDDIAPEALARIKSEYQPKAQSRTQRRALKQSSGAPAIPDEVRRRANNYKMIEAVNPQMRATRLGSKGVLANFDDELAGGISAATRGLYNAVKNRDLSEFGKEYRTEKAARQLVQSEDAAENPATAFIGEMGGSLLSPIGRGAKLLGGGAKVAGKVGAEKIAQVLGKGAARLEKVGPVGSAVLAGMNQGAVSAAGAADEDVLDNAVQGATFGGLFGGALGGAGIAGTRAVQALRDKAPKNAGNVAYQKIADLLEASGTTPARAGAEMNIAARNGNDVMLMDMGVPLRTQAGYLKRNPGLRQAAELERRGMERIEARGQRFEDQVRDVTGDSPDALNRIDDIKDTRKLAGNTDYAEGGAMDKNFVWNDKLESQFATATPSLKAGLKAAVRNIEDARMDTTSLGIKFNEAGDVTYMKIPSMRVFDQVKRGFDAQIGTALKKGDTTTAANLSKELKLLKANVIESNGEYADILATQRDLFQQQQAIELGQKALGRMTKEPRVLAKELKELARTDPEKFAETRIGFVDTLMNLNDGARNPITVFSAAMKTPRQREIMEMMFGGKGSLGKLDRFVKREKRAMQSDARTAAGGQSITSEISGAGEAEVTAAKDIFTKGLTGYAYGGSTGFVAGIARSLDRLRRGESKEAQEEIAKILMSSDGVALKKGVAGAKQAAKRRREKNKAIGEAIGKVTGNTFGTAIGGQ